MENFILAKYLNIICYSQIIVFQDSQQMLDNIIQKQADLTLYLALILTFMRVLINLCSQFYQFVVFLMDQIPITSQIDIRQSLYYCKSMKTFLLVILLPILTIQWWDVGHMLTATIAQIRLNQISPFTSVKFRQLITSINNLVDNRTRTLIQSACWPDDLKERQYNMELWNDLHFIDKPYVEDGVFPVINMTSLAQSAIQLVNNAIKVLSVNINKTTAQRALFARYLVHVVGDIHQPLHSVSLYNETFPSGDRGGNSLKIVLLNGTLNNLHSFWDSGAFRIQNDSWFLIRPLNSQNLTAIKEVAANYIKTYGPQVQALADNLNPSAWAMQSYRFAQNTTYPDMFSTNKISQQYSDKAYQTAKKRVTLAGYRIANLVISIFEKAGYLERRDKRNIIVDEEQSIKERSRSDFILLKTQSE